MAKIFKVICEHSPYERYHRYFIASLPRNDAALLLGYFYLKIEKLAVQRFGSVCDLPVPEETIVHCMSLLGFRECGKPLFWSGVELLDAMNCRDAYVLACSYHPYSKNHIPPFEELDRLYSRFAVQAFEDELRSGGYLVETLRSMGFAVDAPYKRLGAPDDQMSFHTTHLWGAL